MNLLTRSLVAAAGLAASAALPGAADAAVSAFATGSVNMRTCGSTSCPRITTIPAGSPVSIYGCTGGYGWCDTQYGGYRGWVSGRYLQAYAPGYAQPSPVPAIGALLGIAILGAALADRPYYYRPYPYHYGYPRPPVGWYPPYGGWRPPHGSWRPPGGGFGPKPWVQPPGSLLR